MMENAADLVYQESFARVKYLTSDLDPSLYADVSKAVNNIDYVTFPGFKETPF